MNLNHRLIINNRLIGLRMRDYLALLRPAAFGSVIMAVALLAFRTMAESLFTLPDIGLLVTSVVFGTVIYFATLRIAGVEALNEMIELFQEMVMPYARPIAARIPFLRKGV